jgi:hypothetical protein
VIHSANQSRSVYQNAAKTTSLSRRMIDFGPGSFKLALVALFSSHHADLAADLAAWRQRARVHVRVCDAAPDGCNDLGKLHHSRELLGCDASSYDVRRRDVPGHNCLRGFSGRALRGKAGKANISGRLAQADDNAVLHSATRRECEPVSPSPAARCISTRGLWTDRWD